MKVWIATVETDDGLEILGVFGKEKNKEDVRRILSEEYGEDNEVLEEFELEDWEVK